MDHEAVDKRRLLDADDHKRDHRTPSSDLDESPRSFSWRLFWAYTGPGWLMSMAYLDPGNLEADLQSGAYTRYELLWVVLLSTVAGGCYQVLAARLGAVTGKHLAQLCRSEYPRAVSLALWVMTELAIIGSDVQEVLGSAIAFQILFALPLWCGCLLTAVDTLTFLMLHRADKHGNGSRYLEMFFLLLIATMCVCFFADFSVSKPDAREIAKGIVWPRLEQQNVMQAVASLGAIIMPHNIFLHSALVQTRGIDPTRHTKVREANYYFSLESSLALFVSFLINAAVICVFASTFYSSECAALSKPDSISGLAGTGIQTACIPIKAALASGNKIYDARTGNVCHFISHTFTCSPCYVDHRDTSLLYGFSGDLVAPSAGYCQEIGLSEAGEAVKESLGGYARVIWAIGLLASGQASTMTGTYAGQFVMEGFLEIKISAWKRVALTRGVALIPALIVAVVSQNQAFQSDYFNEYLNVLQSVQLPFALLPLLTFTATRSLMGDAFVTSRGLGFVLLAGTALLCTVNYALVYRILDTALPTELSVVTYAVGSLFIMLYAALLLYLVLGYPSSRGGAITGYEVAGGQRSPSKKEMKKEKRRRLRREQEALLSDDEVAV